MVDKTPRPESSAVRAQAQLGGDAVSDGLDVLVVEHHCLAPPADAEQLQRK
jgi:hypothetical protein